MIRNVNPQWGMSVEFESVREMELTIIDCGMGLPEDGLREGRDYEVLTCMDDSYKCADYNNNDCHPGKECWVGCPFVVYC